jgi:sulfite reductase beta subunit-like hemoprotein
VTKPVSLAYAGELDRRLALLRVVRERARTLTMEQLAWAVRWSRFGPELGRCTLAELFSEASAPRLVVRPEPRGRRPGLPAGCPRSCSRPRPAKVRQP